MGGSKGRNEGGAGVWRKGRGDGKERQASVRVLLAFRRCNNAAACSCSFFFCALRCFWICAGVPGGGQSAGRREKGRVSMRSVLRAGIEVRKDSRAGERVVANVACSECSWHSQAHKPQQLASRLCERRDPRGLVLDRRASTRRRSSAAASPPHRAPSPRGPTA